jgi:hypothetical protein
MNWKEVILIYFNLISQYFSGVDGMVILKWIVEKCGNLKCNEQVQSWVLILCYFDNSYGPSVSVTGDFFIG